MTPNEAMAEYQRMRETTRRMLVAATEGQWEGLVSLEIERRAIADRLAGRVDFAATALLAAKDACIRDILEMDTQIRSLTEAWMGEMREMMGTIQSQRKVHKAYSLG
jgi:hypothetical protein